MMPILRRCAGCGRPFNPAQSPYPDCCAPCGQVRSQMEMEYRMQQEMRRAHANRPFWVKVKDKTRFIDDYGGEMGSSMKNAVRFRRIDSEGPIAKPPWMDETELLHPWGKQRRRRR